ncbi:hypothetical protein ACTJKT_02565 [Pseudomonas sp. 22526]|uniref:hypothetical protein n=1 Tax=Pseudomonas sp. 22526 TaxID=3453937 RepID=UPI003F8318A6
MSTEQQLAAVVSAANNLTNTVTGKVGEIDKALADARQQYDAQLQDLKIRLPRLAITKNFTLLPNTAGTLIDSWGIHGQVTTTKLRSITSASQAVGRPAADVEFMLKVQADVREQFPNFDIRATDYWRGAINVWQMQWTEIDASPWLAFPYANDQTSAAAVAAVPLNSYLTMGAFVRVVDGSISGAWSTGSQKGKWRWCSATVSPSGVFGSYYHLHPMRTSSTGLIEIMLAGACTGVVTDPGDWGTMLAIS